MLFMYGQWTLTSHLVFFSSETWVTNLNLIMTEKLLWKGGSDTPLTLHAIYL